MGKKKQAVVSDICFYGTREVGFAYIATLPDGKLISAGFGEDQGISGNLNSLSETLFHACHQLQEQGTRGLARVFDLGGRRMATVDVGNPPWYGSLTWQEAPTYTISVAELLAAAG